MDIEIPQGIQNILSRTSDRSFDVTKDVSTSDENLILHAAMAAPTGVNRRPWHFVVVRNRKILDTLASSLPYCHMASQAPMAIVVCGDKTRFLEGDDSTLWVQDVSAASENLLLAVNALQLGAVWTALYPHTDRMETVSKLLQLPDRFVPFNVIPIGHVAKHHTPLDKWNPDNITRIL